jgi:phenylalanyl-tRNA synthetase beta chain
MKISYSWLNNYINKEVDSELIADVLTDCGLEVEGVEKIQTIKGGLEGLIVGEILSKEKHPEADRLNLTKVNVGNGELLNIVCGAPNVEKGQKVIVATVGTKLYPTEGGDFKIKKSKIRGQVSEGMICAEDEIGLGNSHDGIMVLDASVKVGTLAKDYFNVEDDFVFEIGLTPNRSDATGHIGVARDLVAVLNQSQKINLIKPIVKDFKIDSKDLPIAVEVEDTGLCPRYSGITLRNITVRESPDWLKKRLTSIGLKPINNVVDASNFVLHETGHPLHAFDVDKITDNKVIVRCAKDKAKFTTLDEIERELSSDDLMICNADKEMCIAGVFGGLESGVTETTTSIFLESAYFNPVSIRKSAKRHGLNTDASFRFERGADPNITIYALKRAANLIKELTGGVISSEIVDIYPNPIENVEVSFSYTNCDRLIGLSIDRTTIKDILISLEIEIIEESKEGLQLSIPPFKADVLREVDVIEEVLRIYGYNNIEIPEVLKSSISYREKPEKEKITNVLSDLLVANGFNEMLSNSLTKSDYYKETISELVKIQNPLSRDLDVMRQSMLYNGLETLVYNQNRKNSDLKLFEFGKTYLKKGNGFNEDSILSLFVTGRVSQENWNTDSADVNFYYIKGVVNSILEKFGLDNLNLKTHESDLIYFDYGLKYIINNIDLVHFGKINNQKQNQFDVDKEVFYAEFNYDNLLKLIKLNKIVFKGVPKFPSVRRDLALLINRDINYNTIKEFAQKQDKKLLKSVNLFDVYEGEKLGDGKKSYGISLMFQDENRTLTDIQIDKTMERIVKSLESDLKAQLR